MAPKKKATVLPKFNMNEFYKEHTLDRTATLRLDTCDFSQNVRDDHPGNEFRTSIENVGIDPNDRQLWQLHPLPIEQRAHPG